MQYSANDIADGVILAAISEGTEVNNLKLQSILYYLQGRSLVERGELLFPDPIMKSTNGPVVPAVYDRFAHFGAEPFKAVPVRFDFTEMLTDEEAEPPKTPVIDRDTEKMIGDTVGALRRYDVFSLIRETKRHPVWLVDMNRITPGDWSIPYTEMGLLSMFAQHPQFRIWKPLYQA